MKQRFWTKFVATIMSLATTLSIVSVPAAVPLASQVPATQQVDQEAERSAAEQVLHTLSEQTQPVTAEASDRTSVPNRSLGVDVSAYQGTDMSGYARAGAKFCIVKTTEGTGWVNSKAAAQIRSAKANGMMVMGYHYAHSGGSVSAARNEANYAISHARSMGVPAHSYIAMDFESDAWGSRQANTDAAIAFMQTVRNAGYLPLFYSGSAYMNAHFDTNQIVQKFPGSLWVASYKVLGRQDSPDFDYFPSRNGIAIWQFTDNLKGMGVDGSINVLPLSFLQPAPQPQPKPQPKPNPTYQTKIHFLDSQAGNREVGSQTVSGHQGDQRSYSVPENYHANSGQSNQVTISNNGSVNVYVSHNTETVHQNRSVTRRVLGTLTSSDGTTGSYEYSQTKQVPVTGTKDAVTGKTDWTAVPDFNQIFGEYHPDFAADAAKSKFSYSSQFDHAVLDHVDYSAPAGSSTETVHVYWKAAAAKPVLSAGSASSHHASESSEHHSSSSTSSSSVSSSSTSSSSSSSSSASSSRTSSSSSSSSSASSSSASSSSASSSSDAPTVKPENTVVASARRTVKFEFADGTTKTVVQTATYRADSDSLVDFAGWGMINVPVRQGEVADCSQVPAVSNARELQTYWDSAFSKTHQTSRNQYDQTVVIKYAQNQTSKPQPAKLSSHSSSRTDASAGDSQMGTAARKELQELTKNPAAGSRAENMSRAQAQKYVQARHDATPMSASYNGSPAKQDRHSYVGSLPQTGDVSADRKLQLAAGAGVLICLSVAVTAAVMISRRRRIQQQKQSK